MFAGHFDRHVRTTVCLIILALCKHACALQVQPRAAFIYLVHANKVNQLHDSLTSLYECFLKDHGPYPVLLFHDQHIAAPAKILPERIVDIRWIYLHNFSTFPQHHVQQAHSSQQDWYASDTISTHSAKLQISVPCRPTGNYHHMIRFWWWSIFQQPVVSELDYFCRLDTDSTLLARVPDDIFVTMRNQHFVYGYKVRVSDARKVTDGLWEFIEDYLATHPDASRQAFANGFSIPSSYEVPFEAYYNNFEVSAGYLCYAHCRAA